MTAPPSFPLATAGRIDPRLPAVAATALGGAFVPLLALDPVPVWWAAIGAALAGLHAAAMLYFRRRWVPALGVVALIGVCAGRELELVSARWAAWALGLALGILLALFLSLPAAAALRQRRAPGADALDRALVPISLWLGALALASTAFSGTEPWIERTMSLLGIGESLEHTPRLVGDGRLPWIAALPALALGSALAGSVLVRDAFRIRFLDTVDDAFDRVPWSGEGAAVPLLSGSTIGWAVVPRSRAGAAVFRERGAGVAVAWLPRDLDEARAILRRRAAIALTLLGAEAAGIVALAAVLLYHLGPLTGVTAVVPRRDYACAVRARGDVACWGWNLWGQLGDGTRRHSYAPVPVRGVTDVATLEPPCALLRSGEVRCWGGHPGHPIDARPIEALAPSRLLAAHDATACAVTRDDDVVCWDDPGDPLPIMKAPGATALSLQHRDGCVALPDRVQCWRYHAHRPTSGARMALHSPCARPPDLEPPLPGALTYADGSFHELTARGRVYRWRLPEKPGDPCKGPVVLDGLAGVVRIDGDLALGADGSVRSWAADEETGRCALATTWIEGGAADVRSSYDTWCAARVDGTAWCWGMRNDWGELGDGTRRAHAAPELVRR